MKKNLAARLLVALIGVPLLILVLAVLPPIFVPFALAVICGVSAVEFMTAVKKPDKRRIFIGPVLGAVTIPFGVYFGMREIAVPVCLYTVCVLMFTELMLSRRRKAEFGVTGALAGIFCGVVTPWFMSYLVELKLSSNGTYLVLLPFVISMLSDAGGYFAGIAFGKYHPFPDISPKKSTEGCIGSLVFGAACSMLYGFIAHLISGLEANYVNLALVGLAANPFVQFGDLAFSAIKREVGIKDFSHLLGDHGGMQDRFDSMVFSVPVIYAMVLLMPVFA